ncbi:ABC transporter permease [Nitrospirillum viridazoti]|uniref:Multidrug ABC transporter substrate-binding protein n=1 Tax=Nitrospirillum viridazoti CBAmc TaxID=1441467 RepID=A0A248JS38_9PROT|nr:FtsX-like permease family protein [Nitrospirillum amazonense]ASG21542.1 multidrug ABC transporter substrate-binding protein [Nitrospirillum amazonense CBAmc]TWB42323.1 putative ABC transport system permease protein [Nitrospirillum amazonense]
MTILGLAWAYLKRAALTTTLNVALLALGTGTIVVLILAGTQVQDRLARDAAGVDLVVGAKGSPLQLILSALYQIDIPTGNIPLSQAQALASDPLVAQAVPLALGDSFRGYRIVGTDPAFVALRHAQVATGRLWQAPMEATVGAQVAQAAGLKVGDQFNSNHGLSAGGAVHEGMPYTVVGILAPTGGVVDRLVLTPIDSVWAVHDAHHHHHDGDADEHEHGAGGAQGGAQPAQQPPEREVTSVLLRYRSPIAAALLPRRINTGSVLQAASPAAEMTRLLSLVGIGTDTVRGFGLLLVASSALSIFVALYNATQARRYDLAVMRALGATRMRISCLLLTEALAMGAAGTALGLALGHGAVELAGRLVPQARDMGITGLQFPATEPYLLVLAAGLSVLAALVPAVQAYRTDVSAVLSRG